MNFTKYNNKRNTIKIETVSNYKKKERLNQKIRQIIWKKYIKYKSQMKLSKLILKKA